MAYDFPASPVLNQVYTAPTGQAYVWNGTTWNLSAPGQTKTARRTNLVINGALNISQENGNTEGTVNGYFAADQMAGILSASSAAFGISRIAAGNPSGSQFRLQYRVTTAKASLAAGDFAAITTKLEGLNTQDLNWAGTPKKDTVLAFSFRGPAGTYSVSLRNWNGTGVDYTFLASFVITAGQANTDTTQAIPIPAPPAGMSSWATDNSAMMLLSVDLAAGTTMQAAAGWNSGNFFGVTGMSNGLAAVQSFQVWDVYFGADPDKTGVPPLFEVPDYQTELAKCMRYFQKLGAMFSGNVTSASSYNATVGYMVPPRANPSLAAANISNFSFPATVGTLGNVAGVFVSEQRSANASGAASFQSSYTLNARM